MAINTSEEDSSPRGETSQRRKEIVSDFSAPEYWSNRFEKEKAFEWLADTRAIGPVVLELVKEIITSRSIPSARQSFDHTTSASLSLEQPKSFPIVNILHFGCGTSSLGPDLSTLLHSNSCNTQVVDADYVSESITINNTKGEEETRRSGVPLINLNVLDPDELEATKPDGGWDLLLDKSTADAISCGKGMMRRLEIVSGGKREGEEEGEYELVEPIHILCDNLAAITRRGGKWLCISYSASRFDHLKSTPPPSSASPPQGLSPDTTTPVRSGIPSWKLISAKPVEGAYTGKLSTEVDGNGGKRVVYAPETVVWGYVLERI